MSQEQVATSQVDQPLSKQLLTVNEVATILRVDNTTVRRWIKKGALEAITLPQMGTRNGYRIRSTTINTLLKEDL